MIIMKCTVIGKNARQVCSEIAGITQPAEVSHPEPHVSILLFSGLTRAQQQSIKSVCDKHCVDVFFYSKNTQMVVFDMDSTLIKNECIDLIARRADVEAEVAAITERAMQGELDFTQSLKARVALLRGIPITVYDEIIREIELSPGARELCRVLKVQGIKLAVLSGGFQPIVNWIKEELKLDYAVANHLETTENKSTGIQEFTGQTIGPIVDGTMKADLLVRFATENSFDLENIVAVGDGSNDLLMMATAGYGVAWHAKPLVRAKAPSQLNSETLLDLRYVLINEKSEVSS